MAKRMNEACASVFVQSRKINMSMAENSVLDYSTYIPGGAMSLNRVISPMRKFVRAEGAYMWDDEGRRYIDYHAAFGPYLLGHHDPDVEKAVVGSILDKQSLMGAGTTPWEGEIARMLVEAVPSMAQVQITNTGSEADAYAIRLARAATGRERILVMQGGYNGWSDSVAYNLMDVNDEVRNHVRGTEYAKHPITAGIPKFQDALTHVVEFNDLEAVEKVLSRRDIAAVILEPILQNIGIVKPRDGYLQQLRALCDEYGTILIFDEVKTGFRYALAGYQGLCGVTPDLSTFGKAVANGYPMAVIGGKREIMQYFNHPDPAKKVLIAGTYNAHPIPVAASMAVIRKLNERGDEIYGHLERLGQHIEDGLNTIFSRQSYPTTLVRQGSAFCVYFMDHAPEGWQDIVLHNDNDKDLKYRKALVEKGILQFPTPCKQGSISFAHTKEDIDLTLEITEDVVKSLG